MNDTESNNQKESSRNRLKKQGKQMKYAGFYLPQQVDILISTICAEKGVKKNDFYLFSTIQGIEQMASESQYEKIKEEIKDCIDAMPTGLKKY